MKTDARGVVWFLSLLLLLFVCCGKRTMRVRESNELPKGHNIQFVGGTGSSFDDALIIINAKDQKEGVRAEYDYISEMYGKKDKKWKLKAQSQSREDGRTYDILEIEVLKTQTTHYLYFDITKCSWGKK